MIRNILTNFSARLGLAALNFFMLLLTTHYLGKDIRGEIATIQLGITIIHLISDLAGGPSLVYLVPRTGLRKLLLIGSAWSIFCSIAIGLILIQMDLLPAKYTIEILAMAVLVSLHSLNQNALIGQERIRIFNILHISLGMVQFGIMSLCIFVLHMHESWPFLYASIAGYGISYLAGLYLVTRNAPQPQIDETRPVLLLLFTNGFFTQAASISFQLSLRENYFTLKKMLGDGAVGIFSTALSLGEAILLFSSSVAAVTLARVANRGNHTVERPTIIRLSKISILLTGFGLLFFILLPNEFYTWLLGKDFSQVKESFITLAPGILLVSFGTVYSHYFSGAGKHYLNFISGCFGLVVALIVAKPLISKYVIPGAGWSATLAYATIAIFIFTIFMLVGKDRKADLKTLLPSRDDFAFIRNSFFKKTEN